MNVSERYSVGFLFMEMSKVSIAERVVALKGRGSIGAMREPGRSQGREADEFWSRVTEGVDSARRHALVISEKANHNIHQVAATVRLFKRKHGLDVLVVDYV